MRKHLLESFDRVWIENLHGNRKASEYAPDGRTSETIFAIAGFSPGIQQGVATSLWVKRGDGDGKARVLFRDDINAAKATERREQLLQSLAGESFDERYSEALPNPDNWFSFRPLKITKEYLAWPRVIDLCAEPPSNGLMEKRGGALIDINRSSLEDRMKAYLNNGLSWEDYCATGYQLVNPQARFKPESARERALKEGFIAENVVRYAVRPFDTQWAYYTGVRPVWNEPRPQLWAQIWEGNAFVLTRFRAAKEPEGPPWYYTKVLSDDHLLSPDAVAIPLWLRKTEDRKQYTVANLSAFVINYLEQIGFDRSRNGDPSLAIWMHVLAIGYAAYNLDENTDGVRQNWPRIPFPSSTELLAKSAALGQRIAELLDTETDAAGVSAGAIRPDLSCIALIARSGGGTFQHGRGEMDLASWGHLGKGGAVMPGMGRTKERDYNARELAAIEAGARSLGLGSEESLNRLGQRTLDVYLNDIAFFQNVPLCVWKYTIGGYQVIKKWLSYRDRKVLGRELLLDEIQEVTIVARRIAAILLLEPQLDANYHSVKQSAFDWNVLRRTHEEDRAQI